MHHRILVIRSDRVGDVVLTTPLIRSLRQSFPKAFIAMMIHPSNLALLKGNPHINEIITDDPNGADAGKEGFWQQVRTLRKLRLDTGLMLLPKERHAWMMFLAGIKTRIGVGYKLYQMLTLTKSVSRHKYIPLRHEADYMLDLGLKIGASSRDTTPELFLTEGEKAESRKLLASRGISFQKPLILISPFSRNSSPNWEPEKYLRLIDRLLQKYDVIVNVGPQDATQRFLFADIEGKGAIVLEQGLRDHMAVISQCDIVISSSTGSMHIAGGLGVPTVSIFCPQTACSPLLWGPLGNRSEILLPKADFCQHRCPANSKICTLEDIEVHEVMERIELLLRERKSK